MGNRKGKLITIYDLDISLRWSAVSGDKTIAEGKLRFPEVSHEIEDQGDDYTWETELSSSEGEGDASTKQKVYSSVRGDFVKQLLPVLKTFRAALIDTHARDLGHEDSPQPSPAATTTSNSSAAPTTSASAAASATVKSTPATKSKVAVSNEAVELEGRNACAKEDLWDLLTNAARIPMWTRAPAEFVPLPDHAFSLFNGNVKGKVISASSPNELVSSWRPPTWQPADHFGTLKLQLVQEDEATLLKIKLTGVPEGEEESSKRALEEFYLNGLRRLGLGTMI